MSGDQLFGRLTNDGGELIAEGPCWLDIDARLATLEPERTPGVIQKQDGDLTLEIESGRTLRVSSRAMIVRIRQPEHNNQGEFRDIYRLKLIEVPYPEILNAQDASAAGAAGEGAPASPPASPHFEETPAAR